VTDDCRDLDQHILHQCHRALQALERIGAGALAMRGLTPRQVSVLVAAASRPGISQTALTAITGVDRSTLADILKRLRSKGLITRTRSKTDMRERLVYLTDEGMRAVSEGRAALDLVDERGEAALGQALTTVLRDALARLSLLS